MGILRTALIGGIGYVLGARAGRGRYEQISNTASKLWESGPVRKGRATVKDQASETFHAASATATSKFSDVASSVKDSVKNRGKDDEIVVESEDLFPDVPTATSGN